MVESVACSACAKPATMGESLTPYKTYALFAGSYSVASMHWFHLSKANIYPIHLHSSFLQEAVHQCG